MWAVLESIAFCLDVLMFPEEWKRFRADLDRRGWRRSLVLVIAWSLGLILVILLGLVAIALF